MAGSVGNTEAGFKFAAYHQKFTVSLKYLEEKGSHFYLPLLFKDNPPYRIREIIFSKILHINIK